MAQRGLQFFPAVLPVRAGSTVVFPNEDEIFHNVFSYSPTRTFDLGRYTPDETPPVRDFPNPGVVRLFCEVHSHMRATILVLDTPWFTATDEEGEYRIAEVPPGEYTVVAWVTERIQLRKNVRLSAGEVLRIDWNPE